MPVATYRAKAREADLHEAVRELCKLRGVLLVHHRRSIGTQPGVLDLELIGTRTIYRELKRTGGRVSPAQQVMIELKRAAGQDADLWWPRDLVSGRIAAEITAIASTGEQRARVSELYRLAAESGARARAARARGPR